MLFVLPKVAASSQRTVEANNQLATQWQQQLDSKFGSESGITVRTVSKNKLAVYVSPQHADKLESIKQEVQQMDNVDYTEWAPQYTTLD